MTSDRSDDSHVHMDADGDRLPDAAWVESQRKSVSAAGAGVQFGGTLVVFALLGHFADQQFGTSPWILVTGVALGFAGGTVSLLKKFK